MPDEPRSAEPDDGEIALDLEVADPTTTSIGKDAPAMQIQRVELEGGGDAAAPVRWRRIDEAKS